MSEATRLMQEGEIALQRQDSKTAAALFGQAYVLREELDRDKQIQLQGYLQKLAAVSAPAALPTPPMAGRMSGSTLIDSAAADQQAQARQMSAEVGKKQSEARRLRDTKPQEALKLLQQTREQVAASQLSEEYRTQLTRRIDITLDETEKYVKDHRSEIELDEENQAVLDEVNREPRSPTQSAGEDCRAGRRIQSASRRATLCRDGDRRPPVARDRSG